MSRLERSFKAYRPQVAELYARIDAGEEPSSLGAIAHGYDYYVFEAQANPASLVKLPVAESLSRSFGRGRVRRSVGALSLGSGHLRLEQLVARNSGLLPAIVTKKIAGIGLDAVTEGDVRTITRPRLEEVVETFNYMNAHDLIIEPGIRPDVIVQPGGHISFIDFERHPNALYAHNLKALAWMFGDLPEDISKGTCVQLVTAFHDVCVGALPHSTVAPLTAMIREEMFIEL